MVLALGFTLGCHAPRTPLRPGNGRSAPTPSLGLSATGVGILPCSTLMLETRLLPPGLMTWVCRLVVQSSENLRLSKPPLLLGDLSPGLPRWVVPPFASGCPDEERVSWAPAPGLAW